MNKTAFGGLVFSILTISSLIVFSYISEASAIHQDDPITAALKEKIESDSPILDNRKISDGTYDYIISADAQIRHIRAGDVMRIAGVTIEGHPYYALQQYDHKGKITTTGKMIIENKPYSISHIIEQSIPVPVPQQEFIPEVVKEIIPVKMVIKQPHSTYWRGNYDINVKVFEADKNPTNDYWYKEYLVPNVPITVNIEHENGEHLASIIGFTNENGYFKGSHYITENLVQAGKYFVHVVAGDGASGHTMDLTTFVIGEVVGARGNNDPKSLPTFNPPNPVPILTFVNLIGSNSYDPNGMIVIYRWEQTAGLPVVIADQNAADTSFTTPAAPGTFKFELTVTDNDGNTDVASITIIVT